MIRNIKINDGDAVRDLQTLIRQPSISAKNQGLVECANLVAQIMLNAGIDTKLLYLSNDNNYTEGEEDDNNGSNIPSPPATQPLLPSPPPIVYGEVKSKSNPNGKTILFYNHYDVQPVEPIELWDKNPFSGNIEGNYIFGRGAADDKGELIARIKALEYYIKKTNDVPCNVKFIIEGEEEIGSVHLKEYISLYKEKFRCDGVIWESGFVDKRGRPIISLGQKGILSIEIVSKGPCRDAHSSLAALIENPAWRLVRLLNTLRDDNGKILIENWYNEVRDFTDEEISLIEEEPFDEDALKKEYSISSFISNAKGIEVKKAFAGMPTCNISGLVSGYVGEGSKTVLPSITIARLDFRLVPDMVPQIQFERLKKHIRKYVLSKSNNNNNNYNGGSSNSTTIEIRLLGAEPAARTSINHPFVNIIKEAAVEIYGDAIINVSSAGTGPMFYFNKLLGVPSVCIGGTDIPNRLHSPNEYMRIDLLNKTIKCMIVILEKFAFSCY
jgi:acetylornithine deacetylase/succinyl-diaminopimelate desuccinylase-like protein